jgi:hypothetical protein
MARKPKAEVVPVAAVEFAEFVEDFKRQFPAEWDKLALCPLQHGLDEMVRLFS